MKCIKHESTLVDPGNVIIDTPRRIWRDAFHDRAFYISWSLGKSTLGYRIVWFLWSADIWFGRFPLLKFIIGANILVWGILIWAL